MLPGGKISLAPRPAVAIVVAESSSTSTIAVRSNGTTPLSSSMNAPNASSSSSEEPSARAQRFAASSASTRRSDTALRQAREGPGRVLAQQLVLVLCVLLHRPTFRVATAVPCSDERVPA